MKIATYNVNSIRVRSSVIREWLASHRPDILCVQETKCQDQDFPVADFHGSGYHVVYRGMKTYNGIAIFSRTEPQGVHFGLDDGEPESDEARIARAVIGGVTIVNTYVPNGTRLDTPKYVYKLEWFGRLRRYFDRHLSVKEPAIWCGDMNVAPEPIDVHSPEKHLKHVCFHEDVRRAYKETASWGFVDVFRKLYPDRQQYTFWDYLRPGSLEKNKGWRIDHILATPPLAERSTASDVDIEPRRALRPSDHTFLWAEFDI